MRCSICYAFSSKVLETRFNKEANRIIRRRQCLKCKTRFSTQEILATQQLFIIKRNGKKEVFQWEKIKKSIAIACKKSPVPSSQVDEMIKKVLQWVEQSRDKELTTDIVAKKILEELVKADSLVYRRFAVYTESANKEDLVESIKTESHP